MGLEFPKSSPAEEVGCVKRGRTVRLLEGRDLKDQIVCMCDVAVCANTTPLKIKRLGHVAEGESGVTIELSLYFCGVTDKLRTFRHGRFLIIRAATMERDTATIGICRATFLSSIIIAINIIKILAIICSDIIVCSV
jgi:hypothetical protein